MLKRNNQLKKHDRKVRFVVRRFSYVEPPQYDSPLDLNSLFYTSEDLSRIKKESQDTVQIMMRHGLSIQEDEDRRRCARGLECRTVIGARKQATNQTRSTKAVTEEQELQRKAGICNPEKLAAIYKRTAAACQAEALAIGIQDAIEAKGLYKQTRLLDSATLFQSSSNLNTASGCRVERQIQYDSNKLAFQVYRHGTPANA